MIRWAEACFAAWTISMSSTRASLTVRPSFSEPQMDWTMKMSAPRIDSW